MKMARTIDEAVEMTMPVKGEDGMTIWFRTWGNPSGTPVLFVHGGPGFAAELTPIFWGIIPPRFWCHRVILALP